MKRDWKDAEVKRGPCRVCGTTTNVELAHVTGRENDKFYDLTSGAGSRRRRDDGWVSPLRVVPLCGRYSPDNHHGAYDKHLLDLTPFLTDEEAAQAVLDVGFENARIRISGSRTDPEAA